MKTNKKQKEIIRKLVENVMGDSVDGMYVPNIGWVKGYEFGKTIFDDKNRTVVQEIIFKRFPEPISYTMTFK